MSIGPRLLIAGLVGGGLAALTTFFCMSVLHTEPPAWLLGAIAGGTGVTVNMLLSPKAAVPEGEDASPPQLVGATCVVCDERIKVALDAKHCDECDAPLHTRCAADHAHT